MKPGSPADPSELFRGPAWNYVALEAEIPSAGDFKTTAIGDRSVIVVRDRSGGVGVFENRCAHRGVAFCYEGRGSAKAFQCPYHQWTYDLQGNLIGIPFRKGINGQGGMPDDFDLRDHPLTKVRVATYRGVVFASYDPATEPIEHYLRPILPALDQVFGAGEVRVLGYWRGSRAGDWTRLIEPVCPNASVQRHGEGLAIRQLVLRGVDAAELHWTAFGYASDDEATTRRRLRDSELIGPSALAS